MRVKYHRELIFQNRVYTILFLCILLSFFSCSIDINKNEKTLQQDSMYFENFVLKYSPRNIDMSKDIDDTLQINNVKKLFSNVTKHTKERWLDIILLKQYFYHLKVANQGFDLYGMRKGGTGFIINQFLLVNGLNLEGEFLNSSIVVETVMKRDSLLLDSTVSFILNEIKREETRILKR